MPEHIGHQTRVCKSFVPSVLVYPNASLDSHRVRWRAMNDRARRPIGTVRTDPEADVVIQARAACTSLTPGREGGDPG